jgi:type IV fimbrial biogenesis protein FimT
MKSLQITSHGTFFGKMKTRTKQPGITLIELLITLSVLAILASASLPAFSNLRHTVRMDNSVNALVHSFHLARQISRTKGIHVTICGFGADGCDENGSWAKGWLIFENLDADDPPKIDTGETLLSVHETDNRPNLTSNRSGYTLRPFGRRSTNGTFILCDPRGPDKARSVVISYTGKPRITTDRVTDNSACISDG